MHTQTLTSPSPSPRTMTARSLEPSLAPARRRTGLALVQVSEDLWRATVSDGRILGHIERRIGSDGTVFVAKRLAPAHARFHTLGEFWQLDDAMDCLHSL